MKKYFGAIIVAAFIIFFIVAVSYADSTHICQGNSCNDTPAAGNVTVTALGGAGGNANANSNATGIGVGGNAVATGGNAVANGGSASSQSVGIGGGANVINNNKVDNKVNNNNVVSNKVNNNNTNVNNNKNVNNVKNTNKQAQGQIQGQAQKQGQGQAQSVKNANEQAQNNNQSIAPVQNVITEAPRLAAPTVAAQEVPILQGGKIGDVTEALPDFFGIKKLAKGEKIKKVVKVLNGGWFSNIRLEDVPSAILEGVPAGAKIRYSVWAKDGVTAVTTGGGIAASQSVGANAATGSILPGWASSNANPVFVIFVYEVE